MVRHENPVYSLKLNAKKNKKTVQRALQILLKHFKPSQIFVSTDNSFIITEPAELTLRCSLARVFPELSIANPKFDFSMTYLGDEEPQDIDQETFHDILVDSRRKD